MPTWPSASLNLTPHVLWPWTSFFWSSFPAFSWEIGTTAMIYSERWMWMMTISSTWALRVRDLHACQRSFAGAQHQRRSILLQSYLAHCTPEPCLVPHCARIVWNDLVYSCHKGKTDYTLSERISVLPHACYSQPHFPCSWFVITPLGHVKIRLPCITPIPAVPRQQASACQPRISPSARHELQVTNLVSPWLYIQVVSLS